MPVENSNTKRRLEKRLEEKAEVLLINMPFAFLFRPSLSASLLKATLIPLGIRTKILYFHLKFVELVGTSTYFLLANETPDRQVLAGEWIFAGSLFNPINLDSEGYLENILRNKFFPEKLIRDFLKARDNVEPFLEHCVEEVLRSKPVIVVFPLTSTLQQQVPSLALAKLIKERAPRTTILLGNSNWESVTAVEILRKFPFVDAVIAGEQEIIFPEVVQRILRKGTLASLPGVYCLKSANHETKKSGAPPVRNMDALPIPDYDDFFEQLAICKLDQIEKPRIPFETSRGCWWGEKSHCTFCGLNGFNMIYRSKSSNRALKELMHLAGKYPDCEVYSSDYILDMKYFKDFIPELAAKKLNLKMFYEVKSNLKKEQIRMLRDAGIKTIQPGIESFSDQVLNLMQKGVKGLQNIQLLKWCKELGVKPFWNFIWGIPGEPVEEYLKMAEYIPLLTHLEPPQYAGSIRMDRFSPNFDSFQELGFSKVLPDPIYKYIYPFEEDVIANLAIYFTYEYRERHDVANYTNDLAKQIKVWEENYEYSDLFSVDKGKHLLLWDLRKIAKKPLTVISGIQRILYLACDEVCSLNYLLSILDEYSGAQNCFSKVEDVLQPILDLGLMIREGNSFLSLAVPLGEYSPAEPILQRFHAVLEKIQNSHKDSLCLFL